MAPPPSPNASLQERLLQLASSLQFAWFVGHVTLLLCTFRYAFSYIAFNTASRTARFSYRTAFLAAAATYGIVVFKSFRARARSGKGQGGAIAVIGDENVQYLIMAVCWLMFKQTPLAILPFAVYSIFHVATYTRSNILPALQPQPTVPAGQKPQTSAMADTIGRFVKDYYDTSMTIVAILEIVLWFRLFFSAILFQVGAWLTLAIYTVFLRARFHQSTFVQGAIGQLSARGDAVANRHDMPPAVRQGWEGLKGVVKQAADITDVSRYAQQGQPQPAKKAQ